MRTVLTYGTFDLFHVGHVRLLERASALGDRLYVGVSTDEFNSVKGKKSLLPYEHRSEIVAALRCVSKVFPERDWGQKLIDVRQFSADILAMGDDWKGKFDELESVCEVVYFSRTEGISTTEIKESLSAFGDSRIVELKRALDVMQAIVKQLED